MAITTKRIARALVETQVREHEAGHAALPQRVLIKKKRMTWGDASDLAINDALHGVTPGAVENLIAVCGVPGCGLPVVDVPSGTVCGNGHGSAPIEHVPATPELVDAYAAQLLAIASSKSGRRDVAMMIDGVSATVSDLSTRELRAMKAAINAELRFRKLDNQPTGNRKKA
jgi:hypothetical protein